MCVTAGPRNTCVHIERSRADALILPVAAGGRMAVSAAFLLVIVGDPPMSKLQYVKPEAHLAQGAPGVHRAWLQDRIVDDPSILGLGDLDVLDVERRHPKGRPARPASLHRKSWTRSSWARMKKIAPIRHPRTEPTGRRKARRSVGIVDEVPGHPESEQPEARTEVQPITHRAHRGWKAQQLCRVPRQEAVCPGRGVTR